MYRQSTMTMNSFILGLKNRRCFNSIEWHYQQRYLIVNKYSNQNIWISIFVCINHWWYTEFNSCATRTDLSYQPLILQSRVQNMDVTPSFTMNDLMELPTLTGMELKMSSPNCAKLLYKVPSENYKMRINSVGK